MFTLLFLRPTNPEADYYVSIAMTQYDYPPGMYLTLYTVFKFPGNHAIIPKNRSASSIAASLSGGQRCIFGLSALALL